MDFLTLAKACMDFSDKTGARFFYSEEHGMVIAQVPMSTENLKMWRAACGMFEPAD